MSVSESMPAPDSSPPAPSVPRLVFRALQVRLRFIAVLAVAFLLVGRWDTVRGYWERLTRAATSPTADPPTAAGFEYFCPMDPGVVSDGPNKCGICNMSLVYRKKGEATPLPSGVVARMQVSPYRLQLAGVQTSPIGYQPLARDLEAAGKVTDRDGARALAALEVFPIDVPLVSAGLKITATADAAGRRAFTGTVTRVSNPTAGGSARVAAAIDDPEGVLQPGAMLSARIASPIAAMEPFRSAPTDPPPLAKGEPRNVHVCPQHPSVLQLKAGPCPVDAGETLQMQPLLVNQRVNWWCPMHPNVTAGRAGGRCAECGGMELVPRVVTYRPAGQVLAVPESAVVDTGTRMVVYVERMAGMFDGVEVVLGPRCGDAYPVLKGLEPGERVATAGSFLLDAETRLNPSLAASYFGAGRSATSTPIQPTTTTTAEKTAEVCPVTGKPLGSMGPPFRATVEGTSVALCCEMCVEKLKQNPAKYLKSMPHERKQPKF
jgi:hypothetical protein